MVFLFYFWVFFFLYTRTNIYEEKKKPNNLFYFCNLKKNVFYRLIEN